MGKVTLLVVVNVHTSVHVLVQQVKPEKTFLSVKRGTHLGLQYDSCELEHFTAMFSSFCAV